MKKSFLALALMSAFSGAALAQSAVTVYGVVDMGLARDDNGVATKTSLDSGLQSGSRLGFKGTEDLGNGLKANFVLEMGLKTDTGASDGVTFGRQAYVGLSSVNFGSINLGRQKSLTYVASESIDPFGVGLAGNMNRLFGTVTRFDNAATYTTNSLSGFVGAAQYSFGEQAGSTSKQGIVSLSGTYNAGPVLASLVYEKAKDVVVVGADVEKVLVGGSYDFNVAKAHAAYEQVKTSFAGSSVKANVWMIGATVPVGAGAFLADYTNSSVKDFNDTTAQQYAIGYTYSLSKRTNLYTSFSQTKNDVNVAVNAGAKGATDKLFNVGVRHAF
ncbi:MAG: porin [Undibacterium sp.]|uniref:porin n=1 Tax=Undibacterium sp. TaxID=1914977 RepID=UPI002720BE6A|nr:porin [Undibacterium sp.]MDO8652856.1 porin [Undibacterium sp.]